MINYERKKNEYERTLKALIALKSHFERDHNCTVIFGKKLLTSENNKVSKNTEVSPDLVIYNEDLSRGWVVEIKSSLANPNNGSSSVDWESEINQVLKYDDDLKGWKDSENLSIDHSILGCIGMDWCREFVNSFKTYLEEKDISMSRNILITQFVIDEQTSAAIKFQKEYGDEEILPYLRERSTLPIKLDYIENECARIRVYDDPPPIPYLMSLIWIDVISKKPTEEEWRNALELNTVPKVTISLDELHEEFFKKAGPPLVEGEICQKKIPQRKWIKKALEKFQALEIAKKHRGEQKYDFSVKKFQLSKYEHKLDLYFYEKLKEKGQELDLFI